jgi:ABC-type branched-subunit amino acid transport system substrate-binding protein
MTVPATRATRARTNRRHHVGLVAAALAVAAGGCGSDDPEGGLSIGVLLSFSGFGAASSANSERAVRMAVEAANRGGGVAGRPIAIVDRDTRSDPDRVLGPAAELDAAGVSLIIGPDTPELAVPLVGALERRTLILPSFATAHSPFRRPPGWFVMGTGTARVACELNAQLKSDGRQKPLVVRDTNGYHGLLAWELTRGHGIPQFILSTRQPSSTAAVASLTTMGADSYVLALLPPAASSLVFALTAIGALEDPTRFYLSPTLHTPALLATIPRGALAGAKGVAPGTVAGAAEFAAAFRARWQDGPLDDAYAFYDAGAVASLALARAVARDGAVDRDTLHQHVMAVTRAGQTRVLWNEIDRGIALVATGQEVEYLGLQGPLQFDLSGQTPEANTKWWKVRETDFDDNVPATSDCR